MEEFHHHEHDVFEAADTSVSIVDQYCYMVMHQPKDEIPVLPVTRGGSRTSADTTTEPQQTTPTEEPTPVVTPLEPPDTPEPIPGPTRPPDHSDDHGEALGPVRPPNHSEDHGEIRDKVLERTQRLQRDHPLLRRNFAGISTGHLRATARWTTRVGVLPDGVMQGKRSKKNILALAFHRMAETVSMDTGKAKRKSRLGNLNFQVAVSSVSKTIMYHEIKGTAANQDNLIDFIQRWIRAYGIPDAIKTDSTKTTAGHENRGAEKIVKLLLSYMIRNRYTETEKQWQDAAERAIGTLKVMVMNCYRYARAMGQNPEPELWSDCMAWCANIHNATGNPSINEGMPPNMRRTGETQDVSKYRFAWYEEVEIAPLSVEVPAEPKTGNVISFGENTGNVFCMGVRLKNGQVIYRSDITSLYHPPVTDQGEECVRSLNREEEEEIRKIGEIIYDGPGEEFTTEDPPKSQGDWVGAPGRRPVRTNSNQQPRKKDTVSEDLRDLAERQMRTVDPSLYGEIAEPDAARRYKLKREGFKAHDPNPYAPLAEEDAEELKPKEKPKKKEEATAKRMSLYDKTFSGAGYSTRIQRDTDVDLGYGLPPDDQIRVNKVEEEFWEGYPGIDEVSDENWSLVAISDHRWRSGSLELLCHWQGCHPETLEPWEPTWEPLFRGVAALAKEALEVAQLGEEVADYIMSSVPKCYTKAHTWARGYQTGGIHSFRIEESHKENRYPPKIEVKFGCKVPRGVRQAMTFDKEMDSDKELSDACGGKRWIDAMRKEMLKFWAFGIGEDGCAFKRANPGELPAGSQHVRCHWVFDVKADGTFKARFVAGGDTVNSEGVESSMTMVSAKTVRVMMIAAAMHKQRVLVGDLGNAYLHSFTSEVVHTTLGQEWGERSGWTVIIVKSIYGLVSSAHCFHQYVSKKMYSLGFERCEGEPDVWLRRRGDLWDRVAMYVDDVVVCSTAPEEIIKDMSTVFEFKFYGEPSSYLGSDIHTDDGVMAISSKTYIQESLAQFKRDGRDDMKNLGEAKSPLDENSDPECDESPLLDAYGRRAYQRYIGIAVWVVQLGRIDCCYATQILGRFSNAPREGHMRAMRRFFGYLKKYPSKCIVINPTPIQDLPEVESNQKQKLGLAYPWAREERSEREPEPLGDAIPLVGLVDASHANDKIDYRSVTGLLLFLGSTPIQWRSKRQNTTAGSTFEAEYIAYRQAVDEIKATRFLMRSLGLLVEDATPLYGDNLGMIQNVYQYKSPLKKKHLAICYHRCREAIAAGIIAAGKIDTDLNLSDILTKSLSGPKLALLADALIPRRSQTQLVLAKAKSAPSHTVEPKGSVTV